VDDTIIRGAENNWPAGTEEVLLGQPGMADAAVVGPPDEEWGQRIGAVVFRCPESSWSRLPGSPSERPCGRSPQVERPRSG